MINEIAYDVHWYGPYSLKDLDSEMGSDSGFVLYALYGPHPLYGTDVLLYLGMTEKSLKICISHHKSWISELPNPIKIYGAAIGRFSSWEEADAADEYPPLPEQEIKAIQSLLIIAHQPAYNIRSKESAEIARDVRLFNTGNFGALLPEVSGCYHIVIYPSNRFNPTSRPRAPC
ncbi:MAG: hypothetical protein ACR65R_17305 [Methylomicrobium sp.]